MMRLDNFWLSILEHSALDPCSQAAAEIKQLRALLADFVNGGNAEMARAEAQKYFSEPAYSPLKELR